ncbi:5-formyltetrahydrofolate cyclo-ligase [Candidatus Nomurabacteria bacterium]|nr:5-formyltetrahydrofolate cyclo-ligase [Candidatus Nomurabacteria bacterium]
MSGNTDAEKDEIRRRIKQIRLKQPEIERTLKSVKIVNNLLTLPELGREHVFGRKVALFKSFAGEPDITGLYDYLNNSGAECYFPAIRDNRLTMGKPDINCDINGFIRGKLGILEPTVLPEKEPDMDIVIIPGIAFTTEGKRIGFGKAYYDRYLGSYDILSRPLIIAPVFDFQIVDDFSVSLHDIPINVIVSESEVLRTDCNQRTIYVP